MSPGFLRDLTSPARPTTGLLVLALVLGLAPLIFRSSLSVNLLTQMAVAMVACLSFNLLYGQGGMLSFGHAVYSGLGAYLAIHAMNGIGGALFRLPVPLVPLAGALGGMVAAALLGLVATRRAGTPFAMITLGLGELVAAAALMMPGIFGGEGGIAGNRASGGPIAGIDFGAALPVYFLAAAYAWVAAVLLFALARTPLGRLLNAVRDNPERVEFIGYDPRWIRYWAFVIAGCFAGLAGGLAAVAFEIVTTEALGASRSGAYLLFTFLGGTQHFLGPIFGGVLMVLASVVFSELTRAWLLYLGLVFIFGVLFAPGGLTGVAASVVAALRRGDLQSARARGLAPAVAGLGFLAGLVALTEMLYGLQFRSSPGQRVRVLGLAVDPSRIDHWAWALLVTAVFAGWFGWMRREVGRRMPQADLSETVAESAKATP